MPLKGPTGNQDHLQLSPDMLGLRNNKVRDEVEEAVVYLPEVEEKLKSLSVKTDGHAHELSLAAAEIVQAATDERRGKEIIALVSGESLGLSLTLLAWPSLTTLSSVAAVVIGLVARAC